MFNTFASKAREFDKEVIEAQLAHAPADRVRAIYNRNDWMEERAALMSWWTDEIDAMRTRGRTAARSTQLLG